jgi:hypothetical protein
MRFVHAIAIGLIAVAAPAAAQNMYDPATRIAAQREAMARLSFLDGIWRGPAWAITPQGRQELTQTERSGSFLDGSVKVVEGRGYNADGSVGFNALGVISYDPQARTYAMTSWAMGYMATFPLTVTANGFAWERPERPGVTIRYTATIENGTFREVGDRIVPGAEPVRIFEMNLRRVGDSEWPAGGAVPMR